MTDFPRLDAYDLRRAMNLWWRKFSTAEIAEKLEVEEAAVANSLADEREKRRERAA